jgi:Fe-S cluster assembly ATP-binding protein
MDALCDHFCPFGDCLGCLSFKRRKLQSAAHPFTPENFISLGLVVSVLWGHLFDDPFLRPYFAVFVLVVSVSSLSMTSLLTITDLHVSVADTPIVRGLNLEMQEGEVHAIMGPNGSGKSTLVNALMGHPAYTVTGGSVMFRGENILVMESHERAQAGLFLALQYPKEISGVSLRSFLLAAHRAQVATHPEMTRLSPLQFQKVLLIEMEKLHMDAAFADRSINQGFSGGEKKKAEILQMAILKPSLALMDETDSGLDVDALKIVCEGVNRLRGEKSTAPFSALIVTHYARILDYIAPDTVHVMVKGKIVQSGGAEFAHQLEKEGYAAYGVKEDTNSIALEMD